MKGITSKKEIAKTIELTLLKIYEGLDSNQPSKKTRKFILKSSKSVASEIRDLIKEKVKADKKATLKDLKKAEKQKRKKGNDNKNKSGTNHSKESRGVSILV